MHFIWKMLHNTRTFIVKCLHEHKFFLYFAFNCLKCKNFKSYYTSKYENTTHAWTTLSFITSKNCNSTINHPLNFYPLKTNRDRLNKCLPKCSSSKLKGNYLKIKEFVFSSLSIWNNVTFSCSCWCLKK